MTYKRLPEEPLVGGERNYIIRVSDGAMIPFDKNNKDYQEYLSWLSDGNEPLPAD